MSWSCFLGLDRTIGCSPSPCREIKAIVGRPVDLLTRDSIQRGPNKYFRRFGTPDTRSRSMTVLPDPRERDLVKCEDMRLHAVRACQFMACAAPYLATSWSSPPLSACTEVIGKQHAWFPSRPAGGPPYPLVL